MALSIQSIITLFAKSAPPAEHTVTIDGEVKGTCLHAAFKPVFSLKGFELVLDYTYALGTTSTTLHSRMRAQGAGAGGKEQILVNGQNVDEDDVVIGADDSAGVGTIYVEFKYTEGVNRHRVKFSAPVSAFS